MLIIVKSAPDTIEGERGVKFAADMAADLVLLQSGVYFAQKQRLGDYCGKAYALAEDIRLRGLKESELETNIRPIDYADFVDLMTENDKVAGMF